MSVADLLWIVPFTLAFAAIANRVRIGRRRRERDFEYELEKYIAECEGRPLPVVMVRR
jgi:hypothetical protein